MARAAGGYAAQLPRHGAGAGISTQLSTNISTNISTIIYISYLQEDLTNKRELVSTKQARLSLAQDEFHHLNTTMSAQLSQSTTSCK